MAFLSGRCGFARLLVPLLRPVAGYRLSGSKPGRSILLFVPGNFSTASINMCGENRTYYADRGISVAKQGILI
jgi:hypothetical protein